MFTIAVSMFSVKYGTGVGEFQFSGCHRENDGFESEEAGINKLFCKIN